MRLRGYRWVVDGDIAACFDSLDHQLLLDPMSQRIQDGRVLNLIRLWLDTGIVKHGLTLDGEESLMSGIKKASGKIRQGIGWAFQNLIRQDYDLYRAARYESPDGQPANAGSDDLDQEFLPPQGEIGSQEQKQAVRQMVLSGLMLASGWARPGLQRVAEFAVETLRSPAGRILVKKGLLATGTFAGAAAGFGLAAYLVYRKVENGQVGVIQGSPLSPLLANIYLHPFDVRMTRSGYNLVRFADDWVVLCPTKDNAETAYNAAVKSLDRLHLKVNPEKTRILSPADPLDWLGQSF